MNSRFARFNHVLCVSALLLASTLTAQPPPPLTPDQQAKLKARDELRQEASRLRKEGKLAAAAVLLEKVLAIEMAALGALHLEVAATHRQLAELREEGDELAAARQARAQVLAIRSQLLGSDHWQTIDARVDLDYAILLGKLKPEERQRLRESDRLMDQANALNNKGLNRETLAHVTKVVAIRQEILGSKHIRTATAMALAGVNANLSGDRARAEPLLRQALEIRKQVLGEKHPDHAASLTHLAGMYKVQGNYARAEPLYRQALEIHKGTLGEKAPAFVYSLNNLGTLYYDQGKFAQAEPLFRQSLEIRKQALGDQHPTYAVGLNNLAKLYDSWGDYARAEPLYLQALEITKAKLGEQHPNHVQIINNLAGHYWTLRDFARAERLSSQALKTLKVVLGEKHPAYAVNLNNLGLLYMSQGDFAKAEPLFRQALEIRKSVVGENHPSYAESLNNLAGLYQAQGDNAKAEPLFRQALEIRKTVLGEKHGDYSLSLNNLAILYQSQGNYAQAEPLFRQALEIRKTVLGEKHPGTAACMTNLAFLYHCQGDLVRAEPLYRQALEFTGAALGDRHPYYAKVLNNLAMLYKNRAEFDKAESLYRQALEITRATLGEQHPAHAGYLHNLAGVYRSQGDHARAEPLQRRSLELTRAYVELAAVSQSERQQLAMSESARFRLDSYLSLILLGQLAPDGAFQEVLAWKGSVFLRQMRARLDAADPKLAPLAGELRETASRLAALALSTPTPAQREPWRRQVAELTEKKERLEADLARHSADFRRQQARGQLTAEALRKALPPGVALVDFLEYGHWTADPASKGHWKHERRLAAFVVQADRTVELVDLGPAQAVSAAVEQWRGTINRVLPALAANDPAAQLRRLVWQPLEKHLQGAKLVLLSPDGALGRLPFGALPGSKAGTYLIEDVSLVMIPVPQLLPELLAEPPGPGQPSLLLVGDVDFGAESGAAATASRAAPRSGPERMQWSRLKGTSVEIDALARLFARHQPGGGAAILRDGQATEQALRQQAGRHRILHLATHGFFAPPSLRTALVPDPRRQEAELAAGDQDPFGDRGVAGFHPGLLSGLALAGANRAPQPGRDDGILTATEVAELDLRYVDLAVLSACETGLGEVAGGEGLLGLQRAFQVAGARTTVASLWQVPDQATQVLMERFYTNLWQKKLPKLEALREAQLWMLREGKSHPGVQRGMVRDDAPPLDKTGRLPPYYWAAFVLSGNSR